MLNMLPTESESETVNPYGGEHPSTGRETGERPGFVGARVGDDEDHHHLNGEVEEHASAGLKERERERDSGVEAAPSQPPGLF